MRIKISEPKGTWDFIILSWSLYVLFAIIFEQSVSKNRPVVEMLNIGDSIACIFFFIDVFWRCFAAENKLKFWKWGWIDLIASIPTINYLRWARIFRLFRIFRVIRGLRSASRIAIYFFGNKIQATIVIALTLLFGSILVSSILILEVEKNGGNIKSVPDALWWAMTTVTTVGYGDKYPISEAGKTIGIILMFVGISLFSTTSALIASFLIKSDSKKPTGIELAEIQETLAKIEKLLDKKNSHSSNKEDS